MTPESISDLLSAGIFDGFPYLATKVEGPLRHLMLLPEDWEAGELLDLAIAQEAANRLPTCLALSANQCFLIDDGEVLETAMPPIAGMAVSGRLRPPVEFEIPEHRVRRLEDFIEQKRRRGGFLLSERNHGGQPVTSEDWDRLSGLRPDGVPTGVHRCPICEDWRGEALYGQDLDECYVVTVSCLCKNHNRCAACGESLSDRRLRGNEYDPATGKILYNPGFAGLSHRCSESRVP